MSIEKTKEVKGPISCYYEGYLYIVDDFLNFCGVTKSEKYDFCII